MHPSLALDAACNIQSCCSYMCAKCELPQMLFGQCMLLGAFCQFSQRGRKAGWQVQVTTMSEEIAALKEQVQAKQVLQANMEKDRAIEVLELKAQVQQQQAAIEREKEQQQAMIERDRTERQKAELLQQHQALLDKQKAQEEMQVSLLAESGAISEPMSNTKQQP